MGGKGKSGPVSTNNQMVAMQMEQAEQAKQANIERDARLQQGLSQITDIFGGHPTDATLLDTSSITSHNAPQAQYTYNPFQGPFGYWNINQSASNASLPGGYTWSQLPNSGGDTQWGIYDPNGHLVTSAGSPEQLARAQIWYGGNPNGPTTGGVPSDFYDNFRNSIIDYYMPQEAEQYANARTSLDYNLARAGSLNSSVAAMDVGKLSEQDTMNRAQIASQADTQTAGLRTQVQQDQQQALNQLYSTEDPSVAANTAQNMVANANLTVPLLNPVGALFAPITAGVGNAISGFMNPYAYITGGGGAGGMGTGSVASTPSPSSGTGISGAV